MAVSYRHFEQPIRPIFKGGKRLLASCFVQQGCEDSRLFFGAKNELTSERILENTILKNTIGETMFRVHHCLSVMMCRDLQWDVLQSTEAVGLLIRIWAPATLELLRNECLHCTHETCRLLVVILNCLGL